MTQDVLRAPREQGTQQPYGAVLAHTYTCSHTHEHRRAHRQTHTQARTRALARHHTSVVSPQADKETVCRVGPIRLSELLVPTVLCKCRSWIRQATRRVLGAGPELAEGPEPMLSALPRLQLEVATSCTGLTKSSALFGRRTANLTALQGEPIYCFQETVRTPGS